MFSFNMDGYLALARACLRQKATGRPLAMSREELYQKIEESPDRDRIKADLDMLFATDDVREVDQAGLEVFVEDILPRLSPATFGG